MPLHWAVLIMFLRGEKLLNTNLIGGCRRFVDPDAPEELEVELWDHKVLDRHLA